VLRGLVEDSMQKTVARVQRVIGQRKVGFQIDPQAFDRFAIAATPSFVLIKDRSVPTPCAAGACFSADSFALAAGDVSIDYALRFIQRTAPKYSREAQVFLAKMKGG
jgi:conjugal transfer pilus assembly protein TrbC